MRGAIMPERGTLQMPEPEPEPEMGRFQSGSVTYG